jgi:transketolase
MAEAPAQTAAPERPPEEAKELLKLAARTLRGLAMDAVQAAESGHPGMPMGMADVAAVLWSTFLKHDPKDPHWPDRDRFVLSAGHGSMLLYSLLHLSGYDLPLDELKSFRQLGSKTPGHPEAKHTPGVETTTGPLGQGLSTAVGMALAERMLAASFNTPERVLVDHHTYVIASDGDLMEGVSNEASSLAGHLGLGKLVVLWDDNHISIDGPTDLSFTEDVCARYRALGWHVLGPIDGHDLDAVEEAIRTARAALDRPSLVACRTTIGYGSPNKAGTAAAHGEPLGPDEVTLAKVRLGIPPAPAFFVPDDGAAALRAQAFRGMEAHGAWQGRLDEAKADAAFSARWDTHFGLLFPSRWEEMAPPFPASEKGMATRAASGKVLEALMPRLPWLVGGSADLTPSNKTHTPDLQDQSRQNPGGRYVRFGVREHAMGAALNGLTMHGGLRGYGGTFLIFSDYMKPAVRLAALMKCPSIFVYTHDSIGLGEDGPTHQPVEQLAGLRAIPNLHVVRPADANETIEAWKLALRRTDGPTALALTRQNVPTLDRAKHGPAAGLHRGAYVLTGTEGPPDVILMGTGSEVHLALEARALLAADGIAARVVSMPCWEVFEDQDEAYRREVLPPEVRARVAVEAASPFGWGRYVGLDGAVVGLDRFGESAPYEQVYEQVGITAQAVAAAARRVLGREGAAPDEDAAEEKGGTPESDRGGED